MSKTAIEQAADAVGGQSALARLLGCKPQNVQKMCARGKPPAHHVIAIETATGISRHELRPDLYPADEIKDSSVADQPHSVFSGGA